MTHVVGTATTTIRGKFRFEDIGNFVNSPNLTPVQYKEIADILTANLEGPSRRDDGTIKIDPKNFNDSFEDLKYSLQEMYGFVDEDDEE